MNIWRPRVGRYRNRAHVPRCRHLLGVRSDVVTVFTRDPAIEGETAHASLAGLLVRLPPWHADAACRDVDDRIFYPAKGEQPEPAKRICRTCDVRRECLDEILRIEQGAALTHRTGIWAGLTPRERVNLELLPAAAA